MAPASGSGASWRSWSGKASRPPRRSIPKHARMYPDIIQEGNRLGWEWMAHGPSNSVLLTGMPEDAERPIIVGTLETIAQQTGRRPRGWLGPAPTETDNTLDILADAGIEYVADWCNDEQPYRMKTRSKPIVAMPYTLEIGDIPVFLQHGGSGEDFYRMITDQFDVIYKWRPPVSRALDCPASIHCRPSIPRQASGTRAGPYSQARRGLDHDRQRHPRLVQLRRYGVTGGAADAARCRNKPATPGRRWVSRRRPADAAHARSPRDRRRRLQSRQSECRGAHSRLRVSVKGSQPRGTDC